MQWTLSQVQEHPLWRGLTEKQRRFFELLEKYQLDDVAAAVGAFDLRPQSVQVKLNQIRAAQDTGFLYRAMMGFALPSREELAASAWQLAQSTKDEARKLAAIREAGEILGYKKRREKDPEGEQETPPAQTPGVPSKIPDLSGFTE